MKILKNSIITITTAIILVLVAATFIESSKGTPFVKEYIYGSAWFVAMWAVLAVAACIYMFRRNLYKRRTVFLLHCSLLIILGGALASWLTSESGKLHIRKGETVNLMKSDSGEPKDMGFALTLNEFRIDYYPGTDAAMDYISVVTADGEKMEISMNNIGSCHGWRFTQAGYDSDMQGATLGVYHDPWGIGITYSGYGLLFVSLLSILFSRRTRMTAFYRKAMTGLNGKSGVISLVLVLTSFATNASAQEKINVDRDIADSFGKICVLYDGRITPLNTVATNFVAKLSGKTTWDGLSANEVLCGWVFDIPYWETVKMIEIKDKKAQELLGINGKWASFNDFWNEYNEYKLEKPLKEARLKGDLKLKKQLSDADEKFNVVRMLYGGEMLKMFPYTRKDGRMEWFAPGQPLGKIKLEEKELTFIKKSMDYLAESIITGDKARADELIKKIYSYQHVRGKSVVPSRFAIGCEIFYNGLNSTRFLTIIYLVLSLATVVIAIRQTTQKSRLAMRSGNILTYLMLLHTTVLLALRWYVSGHLPMSNGFETMQFMAWATLILTIAMRKRFLPVRQFGPLLASFALLVAMITDSNPQITHLMPVLQSPLLSIHVMVIMFSYSLLGLMALISIQGIVAHRKRDSAKEEQLAAMSQFLLYPSVALLAIGIFIGAIWANISWGRYWSWDSKETWALITMLIYAAPLHSDIKWMSKPLNIHIYMLLAFLSVLMTYFGVNYFLAGMHSYA